MRTFDLSVVQRGLREQLQASEDLFAVVDRLNRLAQSLQGQERENLLQAVRELTSIGTRIVSKAGQASADIREFRHNIALFGKPRVRVKARKQLVDGPPARTMTTEIGGRNGNG